MDKKLEYVKLVFYEDKKDYDKSWGEVYYKLHYDDNQVERTYKEKITKKEYPLCLRAFRLQEGTNALPFEKYQIYDAKTKKPLNMPYYLINEGKITKMIDNAKNGLESVGEKIDSLKNRIGDIEINKSKNVDKSLLYSIKGGISDIKSDGRRVVLPKKVNKKNLFIKITSIATATVLLASLSSYELKKHKIDYSDMIFITNMSNKKNNLDDKIRNNYIKFEEIMIKMINNDYHDINDEDIDFINKYIYTLNFASVDTFKEGDFYEFDYLHYLDKESPDYKFFFERSMEYSSIFRNQSYHMQDAYEFCAKGCNFLYYTVGALTTNKSYYMPSKEDLYAFSRLSPLSKIVFLNQLKGVVQGINFSYKRDDAPYWWIGLRMDTSGLLKKIDDLLEICNSDLKNDIFNMNNKKI